MKVKFDKDSEEKIDPLFKDFMFFLQEKFPFELSFVVDESFLDIFIGSEKKFFNVAIQRNKINIFKREEDNIVDVYEFDSPALACIFFHKCYEQECLEVFKVFNNSK